MKEIVLQKHNIGLDSEGKPKYSYHVTIPIAIVEGIGWKKGNKLGFRIISVNQLVLFRRSKRDYSKIYKKDVKIYTK